MTSPLRRSTLTIVLCFIVALIEGFDLQAAGTAAAGLRQTFALDPKMMGWGVQRRDHRVAARRFFRRLDR